MSKYSFVVGATITLHVDVEAESLDEAIELAQGAGVVSLCHQCGRGEPDEWSTTGEIDADPATSPLECVYVDHEELDGEELAHAKEAWS